MSSRVVADATQVLAVGDWNRDGIGDVMVRRASGNRLDKALVVTAELTGAKKS